MKAVQAASIAILIAFFFAIVTLGKDLLIPMVLAILIWYLVNICADGIGLLRIGKWQPPRWLAFTAGLASMIGILVLFTNLVSKSVNNVIRTAPAYQQRVEALLEKIATTFGLEESPQINQLVQQIDFNSMVQNLGLTVAGLIGSAGIVLVYTLFIFLEQKCFLPKIDRMAKDDVQKRKVRSIMRRIYNDTKTYIGIKTFTSLLTGLVSFAIMRSVNLDFAVFWALLIFLFNFIPTVGSIIATFFPSVLALVQFPTMGPFFVVVLGVTATQVLVGNILEPRLMGNTLNLSPLVILLSLALWGSLWGIPGAILCVPITVLMTIIFSNFSTTRPFAVMLSRSGELRNEED
jgi:predicted PurR-regulated permease PerM